MPTNSIAPAWMRSLADICFRKLDTQTHDKAAVVCVAVMGEEGFAFYSADNMQELEPEAVITALLEGHAMASAAGLVTWLKQATAELRAATDLPDDPAERAAQLRVRADSAIRAWLRSTLVYAGDAYRESEVEKFVALEPSEAKPHYQVAAAVSHILGLWGGIAQGDIAVQTPDTQKLIEELRDSHSDVQELLMAMERFGSYAKVLMTDNHVTPEYLDDYRVRFEEFEKVYGRIKGDDDDAGA